MNTDVPLLIQIWTKQPQIRCASSVLTRQHLEQMVFAKPYFDSAGLILAIEDGKPMGFCHFGFGPKEDQSDIDYRTGVLAQLRVVDCHRRDEIAGELIARGLDYIRGKGARECYAGARFPFSPFYMGLYGGSRVPGVPHEDVFLAQVCQDNGFRTDKSIFVFQRSLIGFRPTFNRAQQAIRRQFQVQPIIDPLLPSWWQCCTFGCAEIFGFRVTSLDGAEVLGSVYFWDIEPLSRQWGVATSGLVNLEIVQEHRRRGLATFLVAESLKQLAAQNRGGVEVQLRENQESAIGVACKLGFEQISAGTEMRLQW